MKVQALVAVAVGLFLLVPLCNATSINVNTTSGQIQGTSANGIIYFLGVPFAAPPVGNLRWKPPQAHASWSSIFYANTLPNDCAQAGGNGTSGSEDCLYLNVGLPNTDAENLPIMIWIHGGGFEVGSANTYDMQHVVKQGNVIVFSIAYRMGPFANLAQRDLLENGGSANIMLLDQQFAIKWIYDNAAAFGGDQSSITIWGESAGGASVLLQALMPENKGIVTRVISESAASLAIIEKEQALNVGDMFATIVGCDNVDSVYDCLMGLSTNTINMAIPETPYYLLGSGAFWTPVVDGEVLTAQPLELYANGDYYIDEFLFGTNMAEGSLFIGEYYKFDVLMSKTTYDAALDWWFPNDVASIATQYQNSSIDYLINMVYVLTDFEFLCPIHYIANMVNSNNTFVYLFTMTNPEAPFLGSYHGIELGYVYGNYSYSQSFPFSTSQTQLSDSMIGYWTNFATTGNPNGEDNTTSVNWPTWSGAQQIMQFGTPHFASSNYRTQFCDYWSEFYDEGVFTLIHFPNITTIQQTKQQQYRYASSSKL